MKHNKIPVLFIVMSIVITMLDYVVVVSKNNSDRNDRVVVVTKEEPKNSFTLGRVPDQDYNSAMDDDEDLGEAAAATGPVKKESLKKESIADQENADLTSFDNDLNSDDTNDDEALAVDSDDEALEVDSEDEDDYEYEDDYYEEMVLKRYPFLSKTDTKQVDDIMPSLVSIMECIDVVNQSIYTIVMKDGEKLSYQVRSKNMFERYMLRFKKLISTVEKNAFVVEKKLDDMLKKLKDCTSKSCSQSTIQEIKAFGRKVESLMKKMKKDGVIAE